MAMPPSFKAFYERQALYFHDRYTTASKFQTSDAVHDMRVALKRLRAFFNLLEAVNPFFRAERSFAPARRLFRAAGKLRNLQVLQARARQAAQDFGLELSEYYNWLKAGERQEKKSFCRACGRFDEDFFAVSWVSISSAVEGLTENEIAEAASVRLEALLQGLREEVSPGEDAQRLHFLRIRSKEARYALEILQEGRPPDEDRVALDRFLKRVHQSLGRWHDDEIELEFLRRFQEGRAAGPLFSSRSYIEFFRRTEGRKTANLEDFEAGWKELSELLGKGTRPGAEPV
ncbi:MAG: CHAD domain-containing protein [Candidatus Aminicenantes bacterium]